MKKTFLLASLWLGLGSGLAHAEDAPIQAADTKPASVDDLDQRVRVLERQLEIQKEDADAKKAGNITVNADPSSGLSFYNADKTYGLKLSGVLQIDGRFYFEDEAKPQVNAFLPRRARFQVDAQLGSNAKLRYQEDFATGLIVDAYGELKLASFALARVGVQKTPLSLERWRSDPSRDFVELGYTTDLVTDRDTGAWIEVSDPDQAVTLGGGVFNGSNDTTAAVVTDTNDDKDAVAKLFIHPFRFFNTVSLRDFGLGVAGSVGDHSGSPLNSIKSLGQSANPILAYSSNAIVAGKGDSWRVVPQAYLYLGSLSLLGEYVHSEQGVDTAVFTNTGPHDQKEANINNEAWQVQAGWVITGEDASFTGLKLNKNTSTSWGALQLVGRYEGVNFDSSAFTTYANGQGTATWSKGFLDPRTSVTSVQSWGVGLNYVPVNNVKILVDWEESHYTDGDKAGTGAGTLTINREAEKIALTRVQFTY